MVGNHWYVILEAHKLKRSKPLALVRFGQRWVLWRSAEGQLGCLPDQCVHRSASLAQGRVCGQDIMCPFHGFKFNAQGQCTEIPAQGKFAPVPERMRTQASVVREAHGFIWMFWGDQTPGDLPFFADLEQGFSSTTSEVILPVHFTRAVENQLDVMHLPFVHQGTIGRGDRTVVYGPKVVIEGEDMLIWVHNRKDTGAISDPTAKVNYGRSTDQHLHYRFPGIWQNYLSKRFRIFIAFTPIDDAHTVLYLRLYQRFLRIPILTLIVNKILQWFNLRILGEDNRIVIAQQPQDSLTSSEHLIHADLPIVHFREMLRKGLENA